MPQPANNPSDNCLCELSSLSVLRVSGADRVAFLHGQLTRDLHRLADGEAGLAAWCNPKGRVIATFIVVRAAEYIDLLVAADLEEAVVRRLRMFVLRARVEITGRESVTVAGITGNEPPFEAAAAPAAWHWVEHGDLVCLRLPGSVPRLLVYGEPDAVTAVRRHRESTRRAAGENDWTLLNIEQRLPWIDAGLSEQFLPQMLNLDQLGGLDFNKGCYPGQEVIARLHYRGEVKQRLRYGVSDEPLAPGTALYGEQGERAGTVVNSAVHPDGGGRCFAAATTGVDRLHAGDARGPVVLLTP